MNQFDLRVSSFGSACMEPRAKSNLARTPIPRPAIRPGHPFILHQTGSPPVSTSDFASARQIRHEPRIRSAVNRFSSPPRKRILVSLAQTQGWRIVNRLNARTLKLNHNPQDGTIRELHEDTNRRFGGGSAVPRRRGASFSSTIGGSAGQDRGDNRRHANRCARLSIRVRNVHRAHRRHHVRQPLG